MAMAMARGIKTRRENEQKQKDLALEQQRLRTLAKQQKRDQAERERMKQVQADRARQLERESKQFTTDKKALYDSAVAQAEQQSR